jgi:hypothetical protein
MTPDQVTFAWKIAALAGWLGAASVTVSYLLAERKLSRARRTIDQQGREIYRLRLALGRLDEQQRPEQ